MGKRGSTCGDRGAADDAAMAAVEICFKAQQAGSCTCGELGEFIDRGVLLGEMLPKGFRVGTPIAATFEAIPYWFWAAQGRHVSIRDANFSQGGSQSALRKAALARKRQFTHVNYQPNAAAGQLPEEAVQRLALVSYRVQMVCAHGAVF